MKNFTLLLFCCAIFISLNAQEENTAEVEVLKAPASPAFNLLGIAPSSIERPTDITSFMASIQSNSGNFTSFPKNYAVELAPFLLFKSTGPTLNEFDSTNFWRHLLPQTFQLSLGVSQQNANGEITDDGTSFPRGAVGFKVSLVRRPWTDDTKNMYNSLHAAQITLSDAIDEKSLTQELSSLESRAAEKTTIMRFIQQDTTRTDEEKRRLLIPVLSEWRAINDSIAVAKNALLNELDAAAEMKRLASSFEIKREKGFYLDLEGGMVMDFPDRRFNYSTLSKAGLWLTGGFDGHEQLISVLGIARYLYQPDKLYLDESAQLSTDNVSTFDFGARVLVNALKGKFNASSELIYRSLLNNDIIDPSWRFVINLEYTVGSNQKLTFGFGKNFDGTITKDGNLIAALNFIKGFGSKKKID